MGSLRDVLTTESPARLIGVHDGLSAHLAMRAGATGLWVSGLCISASKALPDDEVVTYETLVRRIEDIRRATTLPLLVDGNTGFGDEGVIRYVVRLLEGRGADGICIEDKAFPRRNSFDRVLPHRLEAAEVFAGKVAAAVRGRRRADFLVCARTEGLIAGEPLGSVLARATAYCDAGADVIIVHSRSPVADEVLQFAEEWRYGVPVVIIPTTYPSISIREAGKRGVSGVIWANHLIRASIWASEALLAELLRIDSLTECTTPMAPLDQLLSIVEGFSAEDPRRAEG